MFEDSIEGQGVGECRAIVFVLNKGKTNQFGKAEFAATFRGKDVLQCAQSKVAMYLFHRFEMSDEGFSTPQSWFNIKLFKGKNDPPDKEVSYDSHLRAVKTGYKKCGFIVPKQTHLMRGDSIRFAQAKGLCRDERKALGRWEQGSMDKCYARTLPIDAMRTMAGFHPVHRNYRIPRDVEVPPVLLQKVFTNVDALIEEENENPSTSRNYAKLQFLHLLQYLRKLVLQDSCLLQKHFPEHPLWNHHVFRHEAYVEWKESVCEAMESVGDDEHILSLEERLPPVMEGFEVQMKGMIESIDELKSMGHSIMRKFDKAIKHMNIQISFQDEEDRASSSSKVPNSVPEVCESEYEARNFKMDRSVGTVHRLWQEWFVGLHGLPSVEDMERRGTEWRKEEKDRVYFSKRRNVINFVQHLAHSKDIFDDDAVELVDEYMKEKNKTLNWVGTHVKEMKEYFGGVHTKRDMCLLHV
jgi:Centromere DNA-binding protein complex CBF3 subunit, domain 2/Transcriptional activator of glycolytic enzymes